MYISNVVGKAEADRTTAKLTDITGCTGYFAHCKKINCFHLVRWTIRVGKETCLLIMISGSSERTSKTIFISQCIFTITSVSRLSKYFKIFPAPSIPSQAFVNSQSK